MSSQIPVIEFRIKELRDNDAWGEIRVFARDELLLELSNYPLEDLSRQLEKWSRVVDDKLRPRCFIFEHADSSLLGTFRIEPRPKLWEFTSWKETRRPPCLVELKEYVEMVNNFLNNFSRERRETTT